MGRNVICLGLDQPEIHTKRAPICSYVFKAFFINLRNKTIEFSPQTRTEMFGEKPQIMGMILLHESHEVRSNSSKLILIYILIWSSTVCKMFSRQLHEATIGD